MTGALVALLTLLLLAIVIYVVSGPLRRSRHGHEQPPAECSVLEAAREAKYREMRDAELDYRTGKLSREDYEHLSAALRAEAVEILDRLAHEREQAGSPPPHALRSRDRGEP